MTSLRVETYRVAENHTVRRTPQRFVGTHNTELDIQVRKFYRMFRMFSVHNPSVYFSWKWKRNRRTTHLPFGAPRLFLSRAKSVGELEALEHLVVVGSSLAVHTADAATDAASATRAAPAVDGVAVDAAATAAVADLTVEGEISRVRAAVAPTTPRET